MDSGQLGEAGGIFAGATALLYAVGRGLAWLLNWQGSRDERRSARLKAWEESLDRRDKEHRERVEHRLGAVEKKLSAVTGALMEMCAEMQRLDPGSPTLAKAKQVLAAAFPTDPDVPDVLKNLVRRLDNPDD